MQPRPEPDASSEPRSVEERIVAGLSEAQREAVLHGEGALLIIAGAGTGKTTVLTRRIAHLITSKRARPEEILALTFTDKAALEMAERVDQLIPYGYAATRIATFHAFGDRLLRESALELGLNPQFRVLSRPEAIIFLRERLFSLPLRRLRPLGDPTRHLDALLGVVSRAKDEDVGPDEYVAWAQARLGAAGADEAARDAAEQHAEVAAFYAAYQRLLAEAGCVDFGDQIALALRLLRERPGVRERVRARHRYVLVDEFQDTNHAQLELLRLLAGQPGANLTVVGDDDQAIYRWRGAASANLLAFRALWSGAREVVLRDNYRSTQPILDAATRLIAYNNPYRLEVLAGVDKRLRSTRGDGPSVQHLHFDTVSSEADGVAAAVSERLSRGFRPRDLAILVRSNADADAFLRALNVKGVPQRFTGSRGLYEREEVRVLVAFLRALANPDDSVSLFYLAASEVYRLPEIDLLRLNHWARRKTRPLLEVLRDLVRRVQGSGGREPPASGAAPEFTSGAADDLASVSGAARGAAERLVGDLARAAAELPRLRTGEVLYKWLQATGWLAYLSDPARPENEARVRNIARFFETVKAYGDVAEHDRVPAFVAHLDLLREAGDDPAVAEADPDEDAVQVLTVHKAKGLEFPVVFLVACAEEKFPVRRRAEPLELPSELTRETLAGGDPHLHEERRLFYVAMTRAQDQLLLTSAADYGTTKARKLSRFVVEALDLPSPAPVTRKPGVLEALARHQPPVHVERTLQPLGDDETLVLSFGQLDDYRTCPLKYRYVHVLRVPLLLHHRVVYGAAVHQALQDRFRARLEGREFSEDDLAAAFRRAWISEGFLSREHEEQRLLAGEEALRRFHRHDAEDPLTPTAVEQEFHFRIERNRVVGRYDLVVERRGHVSILDFKTGDVDDEATARQRVRESLQLDLYALAHLKTKGRLPDWVELRFVETGLRAGRKPTLEEAAATEALVRETAALLRTRAFPARPSFMACSQCAFHDVCPYTASRPEGDA
jgi:DNA helicase-2/ATP-dependent DNA helicase PcrA